MSKYENILTVEFLEECIDRRLNLEEIAKIAGCCVTTLWKRLKFFGLKTNPDIKYWNKGLTKNDPRVEKSIKAAKEQKKQLGNPPWNKGIKTGPLTQEQKAKLPPNKNKGIGKYDNILTKEYLIRKQNEGYSHEMISKETGINRRTICNYFDKYGVESHAKNRENAKCRFLTKEYLMEKVDKNKTNFEIVKDYLQEFNIKISYEIVSAKMLDLGLKEESKKRKRGKLFNVLTKNFLLEAKEKNILATDIALALDINVSSVYYFCRKHGVDLIRETKPSTELALIRASKEYRDWRKAVYKRDNYTCQKCNLMGGKLHAHHIKSFHNYPKLRFDINNGITLCEDCHGEEHNWNFRKSVSNNKE